MSMSLGYTLLDGSNVVTSDTDKFFTIDNTSNDDVMLKYNILFLSYKSKIICSDTYDNEKNLQLSSINFLENVLKIKKRIKTLHKEYNCILDQISDIDKQIDELDKIRQNYIEINLSLDKYLVQYNCIKTETKTDIVINETKIIDDKISTISNILRDNKIILEGYETNKIKLIEEIKLLNNIICTNDVTTKNGNPSFTCFICQDKTVECCLNPCGHTFCSSCSSRITNKTCYMCRTKVTSTTKLFFDNVILDE